MLICYVHHLPKISRLSNLPAKLTKNTKTYILLNFSEFGKMIRANILRRIRPQKVYSRLKSDKPDEYSSESGIKTFSDDRVSSNLKANPDEVLSADKLVDELDKPMKASDLEKRGADEIYEKFMEMKDYDGDGRLQVVMKY